MSPRSQRGEGESDPLVAEVRNAADVLSRCLDMLGSRADAAPAGNPVTIPREIYALRRARDAIFPRLFVDPGWDIMLHLYENRRATVTAAAEASCATGVAGARFVNALTHQGLLLAIGDEVELSDQGLAMMDRWAIEASAIVKRWASAPAP